MTTVTLHWQGPFSFFPDQDLPYLFEQDAAAQAGLYLWALPTVDGMKVNYVGKAGGGSMKSTLGGRLWDELKTGLAGQYIQVVDLEPWRRGLRRVLFDYDSFDPVEHKDTLEEMIRMCVGFLAVMDADERTIKRCERAVIQRLRAVYDDGDGYAPFLSNKDGGHNPGKLQMRVCSHVAGVLGLPDGCVLDQDGGIIS